MASFNKQFKFIEDEYGTDVIVNGKKIRAFFKDTNAATDNYFNNQVMFSLQQLNVGDVVEYQDYTWLAVKLVDRNNQYYRTLIKEAAWKTYLRLSTGDLFQVPCIAQMQSMSMVNEVDNFKISQRLVLTFPAWKETTYIDSGFRIIFNRDAWQVIDIDRTANGLCTAHCILTTRLAGDDFENNIPAPPAGGGTEYKVVWRTVFDTVNIGETKQFMAIIQANDVDTSLPVTYKVDDDSLATIDQWGNFTAKSMGKVTITASREGYFSTRATFEVTIPNIGWTIRWENTTSNLDVDRTFQFKAIASYNSAEVPTKTIDYTSSDSSVANIIGTTLYPAKAGTTTIKATIRDVPNVNISTYLTIVQPSFELRFDEASATILMGTTTAMKTALLYRNGTYTSSNDIRYTSSNTSIFTVNNTYGNITLVSTGTATLIAEIAKYGITATMQIHVVENTNEVRFITYEPAMYAGTQQTVKAVFFSNGNIDSGKVITYTSSDTAVATVTGAGIVYGIKYGSVDITASCKVDNITYTDKFTLQVNPENITITWDNTQYLFRIGDVKTSTATIRVNGSTIHSKTIIYSSSDTSVATVSQSGNITAKKDGHATITATIQQNPTISTSFDIVVEEDVYEIAFETFPSMTPLDSEVQIKVITKRNGVNATDIPVTFTSSNPDIAVVSQIGLIGIVTPKAIGQVTISAYVTSRPEIVTLNILTINPSSVYTISATVSWGSNGLAGIGEYGQIIPTVYKDGVVVSNMQVAYRSSDEGLATVSASGGTHFKGVGTSKGRTNVTFDVYLVANPTISTTVRANLLYPVAVSQYGIVFNTNNPETAPAGTVIKLDMTTWRNHNTVVNELYKYTITGNNGNISIDADTNTITCLSASGSNIMIIIQGRTTGAIIDYNLRVTGDVITTECVLESSNQRLFVGFPQRVQAYVKVNGIRVNSSSPVGCKIVPADYTGTLGVGTINQGLKSIDNTYAKGGVANPNNGRNTFEIDNNSAMVHPTSVGTFKLEFTFPDYPWLKHGEQFTLYNPVSKGFDICFWIGTKGGTHTAFNNVIAPTTAFDINAAVKNPVRLSSSAENYNVTILRKIDNIHPFEPNSVSNGLWNTYFSPVASSIKSGTGCTNSNGSIQMNMSEWNNLYSTSLQHNNDYFFYFNNMIEIIPNNPSYYVRFIAHMQ